MELHFLVYSVVKAPAEIGCNWKIPLCAGLVASGVMPRSVIAFATPLPVAAQV